MIKFATHLQVMQLSRAQGPYTATTTMPLRSGTFEAVDGAAGRACRGATGGNLERSQRVPWQSVYAKK